MQGPDRRGEREAGPGGKLSATEAVAKASSALKAYVRSRQTQDQDVTVGTALEELASCGAGDVADEAGPILDHGGRAGHSHPEAEVRFGDVVA